MNRLKFAFALVITLSCQGLNNEYVDLNHKYWYKKKSGSLRLIESKELSYHNKIYPTVTDYSFNENFIIAEQQLDENVTIVLMGDDLFHRFEDYRLYKRDSNILNTSFYKKLRGIVEKDSTLYKTFIANKASQDESENRTIATLLAQEMIKDKKKDMPPGEKEVKYWILIHSNESLIGPLTKEQYLTTKDSLGIPNNLKLKFEVEDSGK